MNNCKKIQVLKCAHAVGKHWECSEKKLKLDGMFAMLHAEKLFSFLFYIDQQTNVFLSQVSNGLQFQVFEHNQIPCVWTWVDIFAQHPIAVVDVNYFLRTAWLALNDTVDPFFVWLLTLLINVLLHAWSVV